MKLSNQNMFLAKLVSTAFVLLSVTLQAPAQQSRQDEPRRGQNPNVQSGDADVQVWVGVDVLPDGINGTDVKNSPTGPDQNLNARYAGEWSAEAIPGLVLTLQIDGDFSLATSVNFERRCSAGVERGNWVVSADTNELLFHIETDTNGRCGLSDLESPMAVVSTESGLTLITNDTAAGEQQIPLVRTEP